MNYRKIWESNFGTIPRDELNRSYEIHHIDGNRNNNNLSNLICVSIEEHFDIHFQQEDWAACRLIAFRLNKSFEEISELAKKSNKKSIENGTHPWVNNGEYQRKLGRKRVKEGTHHFLGPKVNKKRVKEGTHNFLDGDIQHRRVKEGTHNFLGGDIQRNNNLRRVKDGTHPFLDSQKQSERALKRVKDGTHPFLNPPQLKCPHCDKIGARAPMKRWHFDNCKLKIF